MAWKRGLYIVEERCWFERVLILMRVIGLFGGTNVSDVSKVDLN